MKFSIFLVSIFFSTLLTACSSRSGSPENTETSPDTAPSAKLVAQAHADSTDLPTGDNTMTSVDWNGTYTGTIPCGHCEGITVWLTLNLDQTFEFKTSYLGLNDARDEIFTGKFAWDASGSLVTLQGLIGGYPGKFFVGENRIWYLDKDGNRYSGDQEEHYILKKM